MNLTRDVISGELRILILEDQIADAELCQKELKRAGLRFTIHRVETKIDFEAALDQFKPDLIISDFTLPGAFDGLTALELARLKYPEVPFVFVSGTIGEERAVEAMKHGATDYVLKDRMARLGPAVLQILEKRQLRIEKERAEAALKASEVLYRSVFEGAAEGILLSTLDGYLLAANPAAAQILGYGSPEELVSSVTNPGHRLYAEPDARRMLIERVKRDGEVHGYETRGMRKDGTPLWVSLSARLVRDPRGGTAHVLTMISDISERKRTEEARANLAAIVEGSNDAIIGRSLDGVITSWNAGAERMLGYSAAEAIGRPISFMLPPGQHVRTAEINEKVLRGEAIAPHETKRVTKDGRLIEVLSGVSPIKDHDGNIVGASQILRDISELKRAEEMRALLAAVVDSSDDAIVSRALDGTILSWNAGAEKTFGYAAAEMVGRNISVLAPPEFQEKSRRNTEALLRGESVPPFETVRLAKGGRPVHVQITVSAVRDAAGRVAAISAIFRDITERVLSDRRRSMEHTVTKVLAESETIDEAMPKLISTMCEAMDWAYGARWAWNEAEQRLCRSEYWSGFEPAFEPEDRDYWLKLGTGGPGGLLRRAWLAGETTWYEDIERDPTFRRKVSCRKLGLRSAYCFPILDGAKVSGVMEFFGREPRDPDPVMLRITEAVGRQIGQFIRRKQAEGERAVLATIVEQSNDAIVSRALDGTIISWNASAERMFGYTAEEAIGQPITIIVPPERRGTFRPFIDRVMAGESLGAVESLHRRKDESRIITSVALSAIRNEAGEVASVSLSFRDITEVRRLQEEARRRAELTQLLDALARAANEAASLEEAMRRCLERICEYGRWALGRVGMFSVGQRDGVPHTACWHTADPTRFAEFMSLSDKTEHTTTRGQFVGTVLHEKRPVWLSDLAQLPVSSRMGFAARCGLRSAFAFPVIVNGEIAAFMEFFADDARTPDESLLEQIVQVGSQFARLIERGRAVAALRESETRFRELIEQASDGIFVSDAAGNILLANPRYCEMAGYSKDELIGLNIADTYPEGEWAGLLERFARPAEIGSSLFERMMRRKDGTCFPVEISIRFLANGAHQGIVRDISERKRAEMALADSEERFRAAFDQAGVGMALRAIDPRQSRWLRVNQKLCDMLGYTQEELLQLTSVDITPPEDRGLAIEYNEKLLRGDLTSYSREKRYVRKDGRILWANISLTAVNGPDGRRSHVISVIQDITGRKAAEEKVTRLSRVRAILGGINSAIVRIHSQQELFDEACRIAAEQGKFDAAWVGAYDPVRQDITPLAWAGVDAERLAKARSSARSDAPLGLGVTGRAVEKRTAVYVNDLAAASDIGSERRQQAIQLGIRSAIGLPLIVDGAPVAVLTLFTREPDFFNEEELQLLTELSGNISIALEHMARREKIEKLSRIRAVSSETNTAIVHVREREALLREISRIAVEHGKFEFVWVALLDEEKQQIRPVVWTGFSTETAQAVTWASASAPGVLLQEVLSTRQIAVRNDIDAELPVGILRQEAATKGCRSTVCLPFVVDEKVVGAIILFATGRNFFVEDELALLGEAASNVSYALESIAREEKIQRLSRIRDVLGEINAAIVRIRDERELFEEVCRIAVNQGGFGMAWISEFDPVTLDVTPIAYAGADTGDFVTTKTTARADVPLGQGVVGRAIRARDLVFVNDMTAEPDVGSAKRREAIRRGYHSLIALPLLVEGAVFGTLTLYAKAPDFFNEDELKLLRALAGDVSFALENISKEEKLNYFAYYDPLTALPNRTLFIDRAGQQMRGRSGESPLVAMILINLERFRNINETFGRHGGDELLKLVAQRFESAFRGKDYLARIGADGFGVVIRGIRDAESVVHAVDNLVLGCFRQPYQLGGNELRVAAKAGIAMFPADGGDADTLFNNAEAALRKARESGERYLFYAADMNARAAHVLSLETRMRKAVEARQFVLHYQPKINLASGAICGLEALIRWQDPESGLVAPGTFIPLLEETGLILEVGKWALAEALTSREEWSARGCTVPRIAVNVSAIQLQRRDFTEAILGAVQQAGGGPEALELEITESLLMKDVEASIQKLSILRGLGIHIAMDDFGTGYSSLSYLARLPINLVKIDRAFINGLAKNPQDMSIVTTIIALAHSLNLRVVAEGVETREQSQLLKLLKCDEAQGYLFSKPLPATEIEPLLRAPAQVAH